VKPSRSVNTTVIVSATPSDASSTVLAFAFAERIWTVERPSAAIVDGRRSTSRSRNRSSTSTGVAAASGP
jgi:hypothetical protein